MPPHISALGYVLILAAITHFLLRDGITPGLLSKPDYRLLLRTWVFCTVFAFLMPYYWVYMALATVVLIQANRHASHPMILYFGLLYAAPGLSQTIPGLGPIQSLFTISFYRLLTLTLLLPIAIQSLRRDRRRDARDTHRFTDFCVFGLVAWMILRVAVHDSITILMRQTIEITIDIALPYYAISRSVTTYTQLRNAMATLLFASIILSLVSALELAKSWRLYSVIPPHMGIPMGIAAAYNLREEGGYLRTVGSIGNPIALGYILMIGIGALISLSREIKPRLRYIMGGILAAGIIGPQARGPWVGAFALIVFFMAMRKDAIRGLLKGFFGIAVIVLFAMQTPFGKYIPVVGNADTSTFDYRAELIERSKLVIAQNPWMGDLDYIENPILEPMRQGEGIIDIVNSYLAVILPLGIIGLTLFMLAFLSGVTKAYLKLRREPDDRYNVYGRALTASLLASLVVMGTTSTISAMGSMEIALLALCTAYAAGLREEKPADNPSKRSAGSESTPLGRARQKKARFRPHGA